MVQFVEDEVFKNASLGLIKYSDSVLFQGEREFELLIWEFPYEVVLPREDNINELIRRIAEISRFCYDKFGKENVVCFPDSAIGQYKHCANNSVFFRNPAHAMLFKMKFT